MTFAAGGPAQFLKPLAIPGFSGYNRKRNQPCGRLPGEGKGVGGLLRKGLLNEGAMHR